MDNSYVPMFGEENRFEVNTLGEVRYKATKEVLPSAKNERGLFIKVPIKLKTSKYAKPFVLKYVHSVVFESFNKRKCKHSHALKHINGDKYDCRLENIFEKKLYKTVKHSTPSLNPVKYSDVDISWMGAGDTVYM